MSFASTAKFLEPVEFTESKLLELAKRDRFKWFGGRRETGFLTLLRLVGQQKGKEGVVDFLRFLDAEKHKRVATEKLCLELGASDAAQYFTEQKTEYQAQKEV